MNKKTLFIIFVVLVASAFLAYHVAEKKNVMVTSFEECAMHNPVAESWPAQCTHDGKHFVQDIGNELEKIDLIRINSPRPTASIKSPLTIEGEARGFWFFEGSFPVTLLDENGSVLSESFVTAEDVWMTEDFVSFKGDFVFTKPEGITKGTLILKKDNPSGLPEHDDQLIVPVTFN